MSIRWSAEARDDVDRLADFVAAFDPVRAGELEQELSEAPKRLLQFGRRGSRLSDFEPREVREFRVGHYVMRYELDHGDIAVCGFSMQEKTGTRSSAAQLRGRPVGRGAAGPRPA